MKLNSGVGRQFSTNRVLVVLLVVLALLAAGSVYLFLNQSQHAQYETEYVEHADDLRVWSQIIARDANNAAETLVQNHRLWNSRNEFQMHLMMIQDGVPMTGLPPAGESEELEAVVQTWMSMRNSIDAILTTQDQTAKYASTILQLNLEFGDLRDQFSQLTNDLIEAGANVRQVSLAQQQQVLIERILRQLQLMNGINGDLAVSAADSLAQSSLQIGRNVDALIQGDPSRNISAVRTTSLRNQLRDIEQSFSNVSDMVVTVFSGAPELFSVWQAVNEINQDAQSMLSLATQLAQHFAEEHHGVIGMFDMSATTWVILGGLMLLLIVAIGTILVRSTQVDLERTSDANEQNQNAILRLLDELADLADGDLTTQATVTEDFTGAIADSINFAIDQMRDLVQAINSTALQVSSSAQESQATAMHLAEASEHQAQEIAGASAAVNEMAVSIDQVSANAAESTAVAERSVAIAKKGADVVQATINGMDNIREQIQETAKRIKRLGESSQEIGDIVSLINDIADQTNILALNAAIQASMAGDAGRGFAVVADEVQRLAERSSAATKQIEALVKTIQTDTNEAVISMEQTTAEVVRGARLAQDAGVALEEIENVSKNLADLIQNISNAARQQASSAGHISNTMNVIQEITSQTSAGTMATAKSIGNLNQLANEMRASVAGFKLPEDELDQLLGQQDDDLMSA